MRHRTFVVFAFETEVDLIQFKKTKDMELVLERKIAMMDIADEYSMDEILKLFENSYCCYLIYELVDSVDELIKGKNLQGVDAS